MIPLSSQSRPSLFLALALVFLPCACVTQTERLVQRPYAPPAREDSVWEELRAGFGRDSSGQAFYTRAARGIKESVAAWFDDEEDRVDRADEREEARRQYEIERQQAIRRVRQQDTLTGRIEVHQTHRREP